MLSDAAAFPDGSNSTEAGIEIMRERMRTKRLRVFSSCPEWFEEFRLYHRNKDGLIHKVKDDFMSATRIGIMALRFAKPVKLIAQQLAATAGRYDAGSDDPFGDKIAEYSQPSSRQQPRVVDGGDDNPFGD